jgi:hypothetical protein
LHERPQARVVFREACREPLSDIAASGNHHLGHGHQSPERVLDFSPL